IDATIGRAEQVRPADAEAEGTPEAQRVAELELGTAGGPRRVERADPLNADAAVAVRPQRGPQQQPYPASRQRLVPRRLVADQDQAGGAQLSQLSRIELDRSGVR